ncbi:M23 family metallopeptidase [Nocardia puris]|uniref:Peptidase M23-like protein n=1 Tax=Nocardia puris TaxID=208602 RepID=A0A366DY75_9NOCA|nr:M23 family metallopeptidase [Nocardia puris]MBF6210029.1 M23 family metallopeptidase [Nocardia puris]MBF6368220.1 M23 family metallopeptidase [Nocardia puris]MBF6458061.1 M23 family metallopeptidase [Nocardia puris]RBO94224.1 peptidase M23-like protein [Nocardia puris]
MPVTDPLLYRRPGVTRSRRRRVATRAVAVSAAVGASLGLFAAVGPDDAAPAAADSIESHAVEFTAFTPREAQMPQIVPEPVLWEQHRLAQEAARPKTVRPVAGMLTSHYGMRWGAMHAGLDFGDPMGAPIVSVTDGVVLEAGPASGFGLWVRIQQDDGSVGVYGHMQDILVSVGQHVRAGDVIATVGSRGYSTGPHLHYEVHMPGVGPIDPIPWLAARGVDVFRHPA